MSDEWGREKSEGRRECVVSMVSRYSEYAGDMFFSERELTYLYNTLLFHKFT